MGVYKVVYPESTEDANYANFEYLLGWYDFNGMWQQHLFTDWVNLYKYKNEVYNREKTGRIGAINNQETNAITLTAQDISVRDLKVFLSIFKAEKVFRIFQDGTSEVLAPDGKSGNYEQRGIRYQFSFDIMATDSIKLL